MKITSACLLLFAAGVSAFLPATFTNRRSSLVIPRRMTDMPSGSFFNKVPEEGDRKDNPQVTPSQPPRPSDNKATNDEPFDFDKSVAELIRSRKAPSRASEPSTINGVPINKGFGTPKSKKVPPPAKPFTAVGPPDKPVNDPKNPEYDDQGYTLFKNEETGEKSRVFEALVDYPCRFTMKIVGANEGNFAEEIVSCVADVCKKEMEDISYTTRAMGKWTSVTVKAPVENSEMLYGIYEAVDKDPRVKFKF